MIENIRIKGYRAIDEIDFKLNRITVFAGRNNVGKSSVLEALALLLASFNGFKDSITDQNVLKHIVEIRGGYDSLVRSADKVAVIEAQLTDNAKLKLQLAIEKEGFSNLEVEAQDAAENLIHELAKEKVENKIRRLKEELKSIKNELKGLIRPSLEDYENRISKIREKLDHYEKYKEEIIDANAKKIIEKLMFTAVAFVEHEPFSVYIINKDNLGHEETHHKILTEKKIQPAFHARLVGYRSSSTLIEKLPLDKMLRVIEEFRTLIPYFLDYRNGKVVFKYNNKIEIVSLEATGDGFQALFDLAPSAILGARVVVIEEPESHLHPGFMERYTSILLKLAREYRTQYVMSTHSLEFLEELLKQALDNKMLDHISIIRMYRLPNGNLDYEVLSGSEALSELEELGGDLRGP